MSFPIIELPWWGYAIVALGLTHITIVSVTVFLHRCQSHFALTLHPALSHFFRFWLWLTTGIVTKEWVAIHRKHHATVESTDDPHSPQQVGINAVLWGGFFLYRRAAMLPGILDKYGKGTPDDWLEHKLYGKHHYLGLFMMLAIDIVLFGFTAGSAIWIVQMLWIPFWAAGVINGVGHFLGYRNFNLPDASRNIVPWGIVIGGEELHNNHHAYASSAQFSARKWEIDLGWLYVRLFASMKLLKINRKIPVLEYRTENKRFDIEAVRAFSTNRFQVMSNYAREVVQDVWQQEFRVATGESKKVIKSARRLLAAERDKLSEKHQKQLKQFLESNKKLHQVYIMKERLQAIAAKSSTSYENLRQLLDEWCQMAEQSDIESLMRFSTRLKSSVSV